MKKLLLLLAILPFIISCNGQEKKDRKYFDIENFTENTNADDYLKQLKADSVILYGKQEDSKKIEASEIYNCETEEGIKFLWKQYNFEAKNDREQNVGYLNKIKLRRLQMIIYENKLVGIAGSSMFSSSNEIKETMNYLTKKYGKPTNFMENTVIVNLSNEEGGTNKVIKGGKELSYYWQSKDRLISISYAGEEGVFVPIDNSNNTKAIYIPVYEIWMFNKKVINGLKKENIKLEDFFGFTSGFDGMDLDAMLRDISQRKN